MHSMLAVSLLLSLISAKALTIKEVRSARSTVSIEQSHYQNYSNIHEWCKEKYPASYWCDATLLPRQVKIYWENQGRTSNLPAYEGKNKQCGFYDSNQVSKICYNFNCMDQTDSAYIENCMGEKGFVGYMNEIEGLQPPKFKKSHKTCDMLHDDVSDKTPPYDFLVGTSNWLMDISVATYTQVGGKPRAGKDWVKYVSWMCQPAQAKLRKKCHPSYDTRGYCSQENTQIWHEIKESDGFSTIPQLIKVNLENYERDTNYPRYTSGKQCAFYDQEKFSGLCYNLKCDSVGNRDRKYAEQCMGESGFIGYSQEKEQTPTKSSFVFHKSQSCEELGFTNMRTKFNAFYDVSTTTLSMPPDHSREAPRDPAKWALWIGWMCQEKNTDQRIKCHGSWWYKDYCNDKNMEKDIKNKKSGEVLGKAMADILDSNHWSHSRR